MSVQKTTVLLYTSGNDVKTLIAARLLGQTRRYRIVVLSNTSESTVRYSRYCDVFHVEPFWLQNSIRLEYMLHIARLEEAEVIFPVPEAEIQLCATYREAIIDRFKLVPLPDPAVFDGVNDKARFASFLVKHKLPTPGTLVCDNSEAFGNALNYLRFPVIFKPVANLGDGKGIQKFEDREAFEKHLDDNPESYGNCLVQSFVSGDFYSFQGLAIGGELKAFSAYQCVMPPVTSYGPSAGLKFVFDQALLNSAKTLIKALKWTGLFNIDYIRDRSTGTFYALECNPTLWITAWGSQEAGINIADLVVQSALEQTYEIPAYREIYYSDVRLWLKKYRQASDGYRFTLKNTNWKLLLQDPGPALAGFKSAIFQKFIH